MTKSAYRTLWLPVVLCIMTLFLVSAAEVKEGVQAGMKLCYKAIIPSVFPFSVFSAYLSSLPPTEGKTGISRLFSRLFHLPAHAALTFLVGLLCGFPLGAKAVADGYRAGIYTKEEAERMLCFSNNTSISFLIAGVGLSMRGSLRDGVVLFLIQTLLALLCAILLGLGKHDRLLGGTPNRAEQLSTFSFPRAVTNAVQSTLTVCGFVLFFSAILSMLSEYLPHELYPYVAAIVEVSRGCSAAVGAPFGGALTGFAVCFSGISVHMQAAAMLEGTDLSLRRYIPVKILLGLAGAGLMQVWCSFFA